MRASARIVWAALVVAFSGAACATLVGDLEVGDGGGSDGGTVTCTVDSDCVAANACVAGTCPAGTCVFTPVADAGDLPITTLGTCMATACQDGVVVAVEAPQNTPADGVCSKGSCASGTPSQVPESDGTVCMMGTANGECSKGACMVVCGAACDKPCDDGNPCTKDSCDLQNGTCIFAPLNNVPVIGVTPAPCKQDLCVNGEAKVEADDGNIPPAMTDCDTPGCNGGTAIQTPIKTGTACSMPPDGKVCSATGRCVACNGPSDCGTMTECQSFTCSPEGACTTVDVAVNTPLKEQTAGDCQLAVCDGKGGTQENYDPTDPTPNGNQCETPTCTPVTFVTTYPPTAANSPCGMTGQLACDGAGNCTGCQNAEACGTPTFCATPTCTGPDAGAAMTCGFIYAPSGTALPMGMQTPNDCTTLACDGMGNPTQTLANPTDLPTCSGNVCETPTCPGVAANTPCSGGNCTPSCPAKPIDTPNVCPNGGFCNANAMCVVCNESSECVQSPFCGPSFCSSMSKTCIDEPNGTLLPVAQQPVGNCQQLECNGSGMSMSVANNSNVPPVVAPLSPACDTASCNNGMGVFTPQPAGLTCGGVNECDGSGHCLLDNGQVCGSGAVCETGNCVNGYCCNFACGECKSCAVAGHLGVCTNLADLATDGICKGNNACDGNGNCKSADGQACTPGNGSTCASGNCSTDKVCCAVSCSGACSVCAPSSGASCGNAVVGAQDGCGANLACNAGQQCEAVNGQPCTMGSSCASGNCSTDQVCCAVSCSGACNVCAPSSGTSCGNAAVGAPDGCGANLACNASQQCEAVDGVSCTMGSSCASGFCSTDQVCCSVSCSGTCEVCGPTGTVCGNAAVGVQDACGANMACNASQKCEAVDGAACSSNGGCASGFCSTDKVCCAVSCTGTCAACAPSGGATCGNAAVGAQDGCAAGTACNASQQCEAVNGHTCTAGTQCASGNCSTDGVCCAMACSGTCAACAPSGGTTCGNAAVGTQDGCAAGTACNASQQCEAVNNHTCTAGTQCASGNCSTDGVCCAVACSGTCSVCSPSGGTTCENAAVGAQDGCAAGTACNTSQQCEAVNGLSCTPGMGATECASGNCSTDGVCCAVACSGACSVCAPSGGTTCGPAAQGAQDGCAMGMACNSGGTCVTGGANANACVTNGNCVSNNCNTDDALGMDVGQCCPVGCVGPCKNCTNAMLNGVCGNFSVFYADPTCPAGPSSVCDGKGNCTKPNGTTCTSGSECASGTCGGGGPKICQGTTGEPCTMGAQCVSTVCLGTDKCQ